MVANSGRFRASLAVLLQGGSAFAAFLSWSDWLWQTTGKTHGLTPEYLVDALYDYLTTVRQEPVDAVRAWLLQDYMGSGAHARPHCLRAVLPRPTMPERGKKARQLALRQDQHARGVNPS